MIAKFAATFLSAAAVAAPLFAAERADYGDISHKASNVTRAEVRAEVLRARAAGELDVTEANFPFSIAAFSSSLTRAQVTAEARRARAAGELDFTEANFPVIAAGGPKSTLTRAEVRAEVIRARKVGTLDAIGPGVEFAMP